MIGQAIWVMKFDQNVKKLNVFQLGSSVALVRVFCMPPPPPDGKVGNRVAEKFRFFIFTFNKFQPKDNSV